MLCTVFITLQYIKIYNKEILGVFIIVTTNPREALETYDSEVKSFCKRFGCKNSSNFLDFFVSRPYENLIIFTP